MPGPAPVPVPDDDGEPARVELDATSTTTSAAPARLHGQGLPHLDRAPARRGGARGARRRRTSNAEGRSKRDEGDHRGRAASSATRRPSPATRTCTPTWSTSYRRIAHTPVGEGPELPDAVDDRRGTAAGERPAGGGAAARRAPWPKPPDRGTGRSVARFDRSANLLLDRLDDLLHLLLDVVLGRVRRLGHPGGSPSGAVGSATPDSSPPPRGAKPGPTLRTRVPEGSGERGDGAAELLRAQLPGAERGWRGAEGENMTTPSSGSASAVRATASGTVAAVASTSSPAACGERGAVVGERDRPEAAAGQRATSAASGAGSTPRSAPPSRTTVGRSSDRAQARPAAAADGFVASASSIQSPAAGPGTGEARGEVAFGRREDLVVVHPDARQLADHRGRERGVLHAVVGETGLGGRGRRRGAPRTRRGRPRPPSPRAGTTPRPRCLRRSRPRGACRSDTGPSRRASRGGPPRAR